MDGALIGFGTGVNRVQRIGAGLIAKKAVERGLTTPSELERLSDQQIHQFIFKPGFSTAETVTSVSGRGVGMDVVRSNIERIGGTVELTAAAGKGTTLTVKIPLTLGIVSALIVGCGKEHYAIPQISVRELVRVAATDVNTIETVHDAPVFRLRNRLLPLVRLGDLLNVGPADGKDASFFIVVTKVGSLEFGIVVDEVFDTEEIVIKPVARVLRSIPFYSGNTILGDGSVVMILDPNGLAQALGQNTVAAVTDSLQAAEQRGRKKTPMLIFQSGGAARKAVPMALIARLEQIAGDAVEYADDRPVVQYRDELMPLVSLNGAPYWDGDKTRPVLVFSERGRTVGLVVDEIVDIIDEVVDLRIAGNTPGVIGTTVLNGVATDVIDIGHHLAAADVDWFGPDDQVRETWAQGLPRNVLVVDDSPFFLKLMTPLLEARGFNVVTAVTAEQAFRTMQSGQPLDVVITDIEMPDMNGFEFLEKIKADPALAEIPVVALSSNLTPHLMERGRATGFTDLVPKTQRNRILEVLDQMAEELGEAA